MSDVVGAAVDVAEYQHRCRCERTNTASSSVPVKLATCAMEF